MRIPTQPVRRAPQETEEKSFARNEETEVMPNAQRPHRPLGSHAEVR